MCSGLSQVSPSLPPRMPAMALAAWQPGTFSLQRSQLLALLYLERSSKATVRVPPEWNWYPPYPHCPWLSLAGGWHAAAQLTAVASITSDSPARKRTLLIAHFTAFCSPRWPSFPCPWGFLSLPPVTLFPEVTAALSSSSRAWSAAVRTCAGFLKASDQSPTVWDRF